MGQFKDIKIKDIINEINCSFFLPDIQREYVWLSNFKERKIEQLFDSILRGYPIGSFLFWKLKKSDIETNKLSNEESEKLNFQLYKFLEIYDERNTHNEKISIEQINYDDLFIVLDGQQRLTSLYIGLKGARTLKKPKAWWDNPNAFEEKKLFLNIRYFPNPENPEDNYQFEFLKLENVPKNDSNNYWFKIGDILNFPSIISYARQNNLDDKEASTLEKLKDIFCNQNLISYFEESEKDLDKVLKIFIRVNSGGTQLSYSDLLMSILTANFSSDIRDMMNRFVDSLWELGFGVMGRDQVLKTCLLLTNSNHIFKLKNFSKSNISKIESNWLNINSAIYSAVSLLSEFGFRYQLSSAYILSTVAFYIHKNNVVLREDKNEILKFVRFAQITNYFSTSLDNKLDIVSQALSKSANFKDFNKELENNLNAPLRIGIDDIEQLIHLQYGNPAVLPLLQILYPNLDYKNSTFHIDHIYPKSKFNESNTKLLQEYIGKQNFLFNLQLLQGEENMEKKAKDPEIWLSEFFLNDLEKIKEFKSRNYIENDFSLDWENLGSFEEMRKNNIRNKLREVLN